MEKEKGYFASEKAGDESRTIRGFLFNWSPPVLLSLIIFYFSSLPGHTFQLPPFRFVDKSIHFVVFGVLTVLVLRSCRYLKSGNKVSILGILYCILFSLTDEIHQYYVPGRFADLYDFLADVTGVILIGWLYIRFFVNPREDKGNAEV
jgi:VanZ family protein